MCPQTMEIGSVRRSQTNTSVDRQRRHDIFVVGHLCLVHGENSGARVRRGVSAAILEGLLMSNSAVADFCERDKSVAPQAARHLQKFSSYRVKS
jgi:hypothetical protein